MILLYNTGGLMSSCRPLAYGTLAVFQGRLQIDDTPAFTTKAAIGLGTASTYVSALVNDGGIGRPTDYGLGKADDLL